ncbi:LacI family DNA-binding transcriptional regulator [Paenibacillus sp. GYB003]|uniref:LacI family DNA-binding transcriptional regulator n=1 Tax=Paenibacillus sp. GYB003 TaxID=2994392 RepID=UPI002F9671DE
MPRKKTVTLRDLAELLGVSAHTVSKALRGLPGMSEETRAAVVKAAARYGYRTKDQERSLAVERIPIIPHKRRHFKLVIPERSGNSRMYRLLLDGLRDKLGEYGHAIETIAAPAGLTEREPFEAWADRHGLGYTDGLFIHPLIEEPFERMLIELPVPRVLLNFPPPAAEVDSVAWDVGTAVYQSVRHLLSKGHSRILYIGGIHEYRGFRLRWHSFVNAMKEAGLEARPDEHVTETFASRKLWHRDVTEKLRANRSTAILSAVGDNLLQIYEACGSVGLRVPEQLSLVSLEHEANETVPELTRPLLLIRESGVRGAERMLWRLGNPNVPYEHILLQGSFFEGKTVSRPATR